MDTDPMAELPADIRQHLPRYKAPPGLERRVRHMLAQQARAPRLWDRLRAGARRWLPLGASFACGLLVAVAVVGYRAAEPGGDADIAQQVVAAHVRSLLADHLMDVASTDRHTVKPWFTGKLDFAPPVVDLAAAGFPLVGGRLDYVDGRTVAALVYRHGGHVVNVFAMPARDAGAAAPVSGLRQGYQLARWQMGGMRLWAVSDIAREDMDRFVAALQAAD